MSIESRAIGRCCALVFAKYLSSGPLELYGAANTRFDTYQMVSMDSMGPVLRGDRGKTIASDKRRLSSCNDVGLR